MNAITHKPYQTKVYDVSYQFVAEYYSQGEIPEDSPCWEEFVDYVAAAGQVLAEIVGNRRFNNWYDILTTCTGHFASKITEHYLDESALKSMFAGIIESIGEQDDVEAGAA